MNPPQTNQAIDLTQANTMNQVKEFLLSHNRVTEQCFTDCVHDFTTRKLVAKETTCQENCVEKFLKMTQRISQRFMEIQMQQPAMQQAQDQQEKKGFFG